MTYHKNSFGAIAAAILLCCMASFLQANPPAAANATTPAPPPPPPQQAPQFKEYHPMPPRPPHHLQMEIRQFFQKLRTENPQEYQRLMKLKREDRKQFMREIRKHFPNPNEEYHKKLQAIEQECWRISKELRQTTDPARKAQLLQELKDKITESYQMVVAHTSQRLQEMQKHLDDIRKNKDAIQKQRLDFFTNPPDWAKQEPPPPKK